MAIVRTPPEESLEFWCLRCHAPVEHVEVARNFMTRTYSVGLQCHGEQVALEIIDEALYQYAGSPFRVHVFSADRHVEPQRREPRELVRRLEDLALPQQEPKAEEPVKEAKPLQVVIRKRRIMNLSRR